MIGDHFFAQVLTFCLLKPWRLEGVGVRNGTLKMPLVKKHVFFFDALLPSTTLDFMQVEGDWAAANRLVSMVT